MKRAGTLLLLAAALVIALMVWRSPRVNATEDFVRNSGFEERSGSLPAGWSLDQKAAPKGAAAVVSEPRHSGQSSLQLSPNGRNTATDLRENPFGVGQGFPADPFRGKRIHISGWLGASGGATAVAGIYALTKQGGVISAEIKQPSGGEGLTYHEDVLAIPDDRRIAFVIVLCLVHGTSGTAWFDDIQAGTTVPASFGKQPVSAAPAGAATISVDARRVLREIPDTLYGTNLEWIWDGGGIWDAKNRRLNPEIVALTRELHPSLLRFPGGTFADFYHWRDGIGPQEQRRETQHMPGSGSSRHVFGTDEALAFADAVGGHLMITANAGTGTAQEAAEWVRYVNRSGRRVTYWEIGNELYVNDNSAQAKASTMTPERYAHRVLEFARAMRAVDSGIKIGAIGEENYSPSAPKGYRGWTEEVMRTAGGAIDFLSVHSAYAPALAMDKGWSTRTVYAAMLAAPVLIRQSLTEIARKTGPKVKIAVTEWGPYFQVAPDGRFVDHVKTLGSAIYTAGALQAFVSSPETAIANAFKLVDPLFMGWIGKRGEHYAPTGPYFAMQMFTRHFGSRLVAASVTSPTYDSPAVGWVDAVRGVPYLDAVAARGADGKLYLLAVNRHFDSPVTARISVQGFRPVRGSAWVLTGESVDANTGTEPVRVPGVKWAAQAKDDVKPHFDQGGPGQLEIRRLPLEGASASFEYRFPPLSVVSLEMEGS